MKEIDILVTVTYSENVDDADVEWFIGKLGEDIYNIGYAWDDLHLRTREQARREGMPADDED